MQPQPGQPCLAVQSIAQLCTIRAELGHEAGPLFLGQREPGIAQVAAETIHLEGDGAEALEARAYEIVDLPEPGRLGKQDRQAKSR